MYKRIRDQTEIWYQKKLKNPDMGKMTTSELRSMTAIALGESWKEMLEQRRCMIRAFQKTGISLKPDGSEDQHKMHFHGQEVGVPEGLDI